MDTPEYLIQWREMLAELRAELRNRANDPEVKELFAEIKRRVTTKTFTQD